MAPWYEVGDTIAALATSRDAALRGIVRISGPQCLACIQANFRPVAASRNFDDEHPRLFSGSIRTEVPIGEVPVDVYLWPTERSYTRQPCAEIHTLGSPPVLDAVLDAICRAGARLAAPGEFTLRAFLAGRLDLTQAEAVLGVIDARGELELKTALHQLAGGLAQPLHRLRQQLLDVLAHVEAGLDFVEEDIEFIRDEELVQQLAECHEQVAAMLQRMCQRLEITDEPTIVLRGFPNVGKSSLFNALAGRSAAIVADAAGTTRDYVTQRLDLGGYQVVLVDTAGIESPAGAETLVNASQRIASQQAQQAWLQLLCLDSSRPLDQLERQEIEREPLVARLVVLTKSDQPRRCEFDGTAIATSSTTGAGLVELRAAVTRALERCGGGDREVVANTAIRCRDSLRRAAEGLQRAHDVALRKYGAELVAAELRTTIDELGTIVGAVYTDDLLDRIFSRFCIGK